MTSPNFPLLSALVRVCEYSYRKGVADAASYGDAGYILEIADRDDAYTTLRFLTDEGGRNLSQEFYQDIICTYCGRLDAGVLRRFMATVMGQNSMKRSMVTLIEAQYRQGLRDGCSVDKDRGVVFFDKVEKGITHARLNRKTLTQAVYIDELKAMCGQIHNSRQMAGRASSMQELRRMMAGALLRYKETMEDAEH
jgi:hypothetical protein